ncbi:MAG TPA: hypothetical protein VGG28_18880 [Kofleriaceae bacterium]|jgi:hypothetical protein
MRRSAVVLALVLSAGPAFAQAPGAIPPTNVPVAQPQSRADRIKQRIRERRAFELTDALDLDQKTAARMSAVMDRYDGEFDHLLAKRGELQQRLDNADQIKDPKVLAKLIDDAMANQRAFWDVEERRLGELRTVLTPQQTARLIVTLPQLERQLQNQLQKAINQKAPARRNNPNRRPIDDDDD